MTGTLTETDDLLLLDLDPGEPECTSRSRHSCTKVARFVCVSSAPCRDPEPMILWCEGRYEMHMRRQGDCICSWCRRLTIDCWKVRPLWR